MLAIRSYTSLGTTLFIACISATEYKTFNVQHKDKYCWPCIYLYGLQRSESAYFDVCKSKSLFVLSTLIAFVTFYTEKQTPVIILLPEVLIKLHLTTIS